jgi:hypothetical protein
MGRFFKLAQGASLDVALFPNNNMKLDEFANSLFNDLRQDYTYLLIGESEQTTLSGFPALSFQYGFIDEQNSYVAVAYFIAVGNKIYDILYTATSEGSNISLPVAYKASKYFD